MLDALFDLVFSSLYGAVIFLIALPAALAYGAWQGLVRTARAIGARRKGRDGDA